MKKKIIAIVVIVILVITALLIPTETYQKWFGKTPVDQNPQDQYDHHQIVFLKNQAGLLAGVKVPVEAIEEDQILQKWELLTKKVSQLPSGYTSPVNTATELIEHRVEGNKLILNVSEDFLNSEGRLTIDAIAWTFIDDEIEEVVILVNGEQINTLKDYTFKRIVKENGINYKFETMFLDLAYATTVVHYYDEYILPVTYFHLEKDTCHFILSKTVFEDTYTCGEDIYDYVLTNEAMVISLLNTNELDELMIASLSDSIKANYDVSRLTINGTETVIHEVVFKPET